MKWLSERVRNPTAVPLALVGQCSHSPDLLSTSSELLSQKLPAQQEMRHTDSGGMHMDNSSRGRTKRALWEGDHLPTQGEVGE